MPTRGAGQEPKKTGTSSSNSRTKTRGRSRKTGGRDHESLYTFDVRLLRGPRTKRPSAKGISRVIELGDRSALHDLHLAIFAAYDREEEHLYEFQYGRRFGDPANERYDAPSPAGWESDAGNAETTSLGDAPMRKGSVFYYWFDFGDDWIHEIRVTDVRPAEGAQPRGLIEAVGKSPPQYPDDE